MSLYKTLEVEPDATQEDIKRAYRKKAKEHHPDKSFSHHYHGDNGKAFIPIAKAYLILSDANKRKRYDETGIEEDVSSSAKAANGLIQKLFAQLIDKVGVEGVLRTDVVGTLNESLNLGVKQLKIDREKTLKQKKAIHKIWMRIKDKSGHNNLSVVVKGQIGEENHKLKSILLDLETIKIATEMLKDYSFNFDKKKKTETVTSSINKYTFTIKSW